MAALRTTVRLKGSLLEQAKREAARRETTLTALMEEGLRLVLAQRRNSRSIPAKLPVCRAGGGVLPGVDLNDSADLLDRMEGRR